MKNLGKASMRIEWNEDGKLNVYHGTDNCLLATKELKESDQNDWEKLWGFLVKELNLKKLYS